MGRLEDALPLLERSLAIGEKALGPEHPTVGTTLNHLGSLLKEMGRKQEALPLLERALPMYEQKLGVDHKKTIVCAENLAALRKQISQ